MMALAGSCLCGRVAFEVLAEPMGPSVCHCGQCRKQSGHLWASAYVADVDLKITGHPKWYESSPDCQRGFCPDCGSFLFWRKSGEGHTSFSLGALDAPTGLTLKKHIFTADKGDYYDITDGLPQS